MKKYLLFILLLFSITGGATNSEAKDQSESTSISFDIGILGLLGLLSFTITPIRNQLKKRGIISHTPVQESFSNDEICKLSQFYTKVNDLEIQIKSLNSQHRSLKTEVEREIQRLENQTDFQMDQMHKFINESNTKNEIIVTESISHTVITNTVQPPTSRTSDLFHIGTPSENKPISIISKEFKQRDHYYEIEIDQLDPMNALFRISSLANINRMMGQPDNYITPACECNSTNFETGKKIQTIKDGKLQKRGNEWFLVEKSIIQII